MFFFNEDRPNIGQELLNVPMGDMIRDMAFAIADAQMKLDEKSIEVTQMLGGLKQIPGIGGTVHFEDSRVFFGKEKVKMLNAFEIYNSSGDAEYKTRILEGLGIERYEFDTKYDASSSLVADYNNRKFTPEDGAFYSQGTDGNKKFFKYESSGKNILPRSSIFVTEIKVVGKALQILQPPGFTEVKYYNVPIKPKGIISAEDAIYIPSRVSMLELGFSPTFYQFVDTIIEVKISITYVSEISENTDQTSPKFKSLNRIIYTSVVNSNHSQKFSYSTNGSSLLRTKLVPIPPPAILEERIRALMEVAREENAFKAPQPTNTADPNSVEKYEFVVIEESEVIDTDPTPSDTDS